jgi:hypothetical protein
MALGTGLALLIRRSRVAPVSDTLTGATAGVR